MFLFPYKKRHNPNKPILSSKLDPSMAMISTSRGRRLPILQDVDHDFATFAYLDKVQQEVDIEEGEDSYNDDGNSNRCPGKLLLYLVFWFWPQLYEV